MRIPRTIFIEDFPCSLREYKKVPVGVKCDFDLFSRDNHRRNELADRARFCCGEDFRLFAAEVGANQLIKTEREIA